MNRPKISLLMIAMIATLSFHCFSQQAAAKAPEGFTPLFDGTTLQGWKGLVGSPVSRAKMSPWWYGHNAVGFLLTAGFLGMMYYFVPKQAERPVYS
ncbi:MAG: cbb3-type cytochrome c oxidase subunit I, partial [Planctomycetaceae bacterium]|nr:cbb3-type cytochrome c oxidase subunit I [Planctomycetaceae bacterium]